MFLLGLLSLIDAMTDRPLEEMLDQMPLDEQLHNALLGEMCPMRDIFEIALCYERANWQLLMTIQDELGCDEDLIPDIYLDALEWAHAIDV